MKRLPTLLFLLSLALPSIAEPTLDLSPSRENLYLGESLILEIKVGGSAEPDPPDVSRITNASVELLGSQNISHQTIVIVNGQMRREGFTGRAFHYKVTPIRQGTLVLGPVTARIGGKTLTREGPSIQVTGIEAQDIVSVSVTPSRDAVLVDEPFEIRFAVRIRKLPGNFAGTDPLFRGEPPHLELPFVTPQPAEGLDGPDIQRLLNDRLANRDQAAFTINDFSIQPDIFDFSALMAQQRIPARFKLDRESVDPDGHPCWEYSLTIRYTALNEATHTFGPVLFKGRIPTNIREDGSAEARDIFAVGPAAIVRVIPPPEQNRPDSYIGAIGSGLNVESAIDAQTCNVGDPLTLTLSISGPVQMRNVFPPKLGLQSSLVSLFEVYDDTVKTSRKDGTLVCRYTLRPREPGSIELPPIEVTYYDTSNRQYCVVATRPIPLKVRQSTEITVSQVIGGSTNTAAGGRAPLQSDMAPAGMRMGRNGTDTRSLPGGGIIRLAAMATGPAVFFLALMIRFLFRRRDHILQSIRSRRALSIATRKLVNAARARTDFDANACRAFRLYLGMRLQIPSASLTPAEAHASLLKHKVPIETATAFADRLQEHFDRAFHSAGTEPARPDPTESIRVLHAVEKALRQPSRLSSGIPMTALLLALSMASATSTRAQDTNREFLWNEANAAMLSASQPEEFLEAASIYQKLVDSGARNGDLFFNQGTALLLAGKHREAAMTLLRAERYEGARPDVRRNLSIAWGHAAGMKTPFTPWSRMVLFWHYSPACSTRATFAAGAFLCVWLLATLLLLGFRRIILPLFWIAILIFVLAGTSSLTTIIQENRAPRPVSLRALPPVEP